MVTWKSEVRLPCQSVGIPEPKRQWFEAGDVPLNQQPRINVDSDGTLRISNAQRSDQGEYTCLVSNEHGKDHISYHLLVQGKYTSVKILFQYKNYLSLKSSHTIHYYFVNETSHGF